MNAATNSDWRDNIKRQTVKLGFWTFAWVASLALAVFGPQFLWADNSSFTVAAIALNVMLGVGMIIANKNHLQSLDELKQRIQLEAMGITLGVTVVAGLAYSALDITNVIIWDAEISNLVFLMGITYLTATLVANRKYQ